MAFTCLNELEISGGSAKERAAAAALVLAAPSVDEGTATLRETEPAAPFLVLRLQSVDGLPEDELGVIAPQFPGLAFTLAYFSIDGEFYGYARTGAGDGVSGAAAGVPASLGPLAAGASAAESADFTEDTRDIVGRRHDGDCMAFVRETYGLLRR